MNPETSIATLVIDCATAEPVRAMYVALGAIPDPRYPGTDALLLDGMTLSFQEIDDYRPPIWPGADRPAQVHLDFFVDSLEGTQRHLESFGARTAATQYHLDNGLLLMLDPAGHPFGIGARPDTV